jgi:hypothetical protein
MGSGSDSRAPVAGAQTTDSIRNPSETTQGTTRSAGTLSLWLGFLGEDVTEYRRGDEVKRTRPAWAWVLVTLIRCATGTGLALTLKEIAEWWTTHG